MKYKLQDVQYTYTYNISETDGANCKFCDNLYKYWVRNIAKIGERLPP